LVKIIERANEIFSKNDVAIATGSSLDFFFGKFSGEMNDEALDEFCCLDDTDVLFAIKKWSRHPDKILSLLCTGLLNRKLLKAHLQAEPLIATEVEALKQKAVKDYQISYEEAGYLVFTGEASNTTYTLGAEHINVLFKDGTVKNISQVDNPLIHHTLSSPVKKFYICSIM
jgi:hypothetical protein